MTTLNSADAIYLGANAAKRVYAGDVEVWGKHFDPSNLPGLAVWLDAADYTPGTWPNRGSGAQPTIVGAPNPALSATPLNGHPVVRFTVSEGRVRILAGSGVGIDWTLAYVGRLVAGGFQGRVVAASYPPNNLLYGFWNGYEDVAYDNGFAVPDTRTAVTAAWKMYSADGVTGDPPHGISNTARLFSHGVLLGTVPSAAGWGGTFNLSGYAPDTAAETCDCEVAEVVIYDRKLADAERVQVEQYLTTKYSL